MCILECVRACVCARVCACARVCVGMCAFAVMRVYVCILYIDVLYYVCACSGICVYVFYA